MALQAAFHQPTEDLLAAGVNDVTLRGVTHPGVVALSIFGSITVAGLSVAVEGPSNNPAKDAAHAAVSLCDLLLNGLVTPPSNEHQGLEGGR